MISTVVPIDYVQSKQCFSLPLDPLRAPSNLATDEIAGTGWTERHLCRTLWGYIMSPWSKTSPEETSKSKGVHGGQQLFSTAYFAFVQALKTEPDLGSISKTAMSRC